MFHLSETTTQDSAVNLQLKDKGQVLKDISPVIQKGSSLLSYLTENVVYDTTYQRPKRQFKRHSHLYLCDPNDPYVASTRRCYQVNDSTEVK